MDEKNKNDQQLETIAQNTVEEFEIEAQADEALLEVDKAWKNRAKDVLDQATVLTQAASAMDNATDEDVFVPDPQFNELYDEVDAVVQAENDVFNGDLKGNRWLKKDWKESNEPLDTDPEAVIGEKIKEEQSETDQRMLTDEIATEMEEMQ